MAKEIVNQSIFEHNSTCSRPTQWFRLSSSICFTNTALQYAYIKRLLISQPGIVLIFLHQQ